MTSIKCDFCKRDGATWRYPCKSFLVPALKWQSVDDWAACEDCAPYIEKDELDKLAFLLTGLMVFSDGRDPSREADAIHTVIYGITRGVYEQFKTNRKGVRVLA